VDLGHGGAEDLQHGGAGFGLAAMDDLDQRMALVIIGALVG